MGIHLWLLEVFQHIPGGQQSCLPCWIIKRKTHACVLWHVYFRQRQLLIFLVHISTRAYFLHIPLIQFFRVFLESIALRLWEKFQVEDFSASTSALQVKSVHLSSLLIVTSALQFLCTWNGPAWPPAGLSHPFRFRKPCSQWPTWGSVHLTTYNVCVYVVYGWLADTWILASANSAVCATGWCEVFCHRAIGYVSPQKLLPFLTFVIPYPSDQWIGKPHVYIQVDG